MADEGGIRKTNIVLLIFGLTVLGCTGNHHKHPCYKNNTYPTKQIDTAWITFNLKGLLHQNESLKIYSVSGECYMTGYSEQDLGIPTNAADVDNHRPVKERLKSLDTFRGRFTTQLWPMTLKVCWEH
ncbi:hypothetical protein MAR_028176 [Mya arenaria]|uniref:Uncharacterized protein n=1 Tax=Mya arenaria TaxID=6604 RepID=A0ABY7DEQ9_MYAAR|nr:hypothetical protein MAR_028176 [Mya arenaria]